MLVKTALVKASISEGSISEDSIQVNSSSKNWISEVAHSINQDSFAHKTVFTQS